MFKWLRRPGKRQTTLADLAAGQAADTALDAANLVATEELHEEIADQARHATPTTTSSTRRIFISSTYIDLKEHRRVLKYHLERMRMYPVVMETFGAGGTDATTVSLKEITESDIVVLLVAWRYGLVPKGAIRSITHQEYEEARRQGKPIFVFLADPATEADYTLYPASVRNPEHAAQLAAFRAELDNPNHYTHDPFTTPDNLAALAVTAIARYLLPPGSEVSGRIIALADMPRHGTFVGRTEVLPGLLERLRAGEDVSIYALRGMGGVGKTALAAEAVTHLKDDPTLFPGGIAWVDCTNLSQPSDLDTLVERVARALELDDVRGRSDPQQRRAALAATLATRPLTLLTLDNLEPGLPSEVVLQTLAHQGHTTLLLTARQRVAPGVARALIVPPLPDAEAVTLFAERLSQATWGPHARPTEAERADIPPIVEAVGGLPKAVELLATYAGGQNIALPALRADLAARNINAAAFRDNAEQTLTQTFDLSWQVLSPQQQALFAGLSLLGGQVSPARPPWPWQQPPLHTSPTLTTLCPMPSAT